MNKATISFYAPKGHNHHWHVVVYCQKIKTRLIDAPTLETAILDLQLALKESNIIAGKSPELLAKQLTVFKKNKIENRKDIVQWKKGKKLLMEIKKGLRREVPKQ